MASPFLHIIEQHAEEAAFLWLLYSQEQETPNPNPDQLAQLKKRINAHIKGLIQAGDDGWNCCVKALEAHPQSGEVFAASMLALSSSNKGRLEKIQQTIKAAPETTNGMFAAQGWHSFQTIKPITDQFVAAESATGKGIGLADSKH